jgi:hypothetical protein
MSKNTDDISKRVARLTNRQKVGEKNNVKNPEIPKRPRGRPRKNPESVTNNNGRSSRNINDISTDYQKPIRIDESNAGKFTTDVENIRSVTTNNGRITNSTHNTSRKNTGYTRKNVGDNSSFNESGNDLTNNSAGFASTIKNKLRDSAKSSLKIVSGIGTDDEETESFFEKVNPIPKVKGFVQNAAQTLIQDELTVFDDDEIEEKRDDIIEMIIGWGDDLNKFLTISNKKHALDKSQGICDIWDMDKQEATAIANIWLKRAKRDEKAAAVLRMAMDGNDYFRTIMILGQRSFRTANWYPDNDGFNLTHWSKK